ncbi:MAG: ABC transporter permease [Christensenellaceae bacterium]|jgi:spermidine/putrescine transport system permease protein|nr:ABC transporter permease [Christensenellaceae bacterium]
MGTKIKNISMKIASRIKNFRITRSVFAYPYVLFLMMFVIMPLVILLINAFIVNEKFSFENFANFFNDGSSVDTLMFSLLIGIITTVLCILLGYPVAYILSKWSSGRLIVLLFILPMWVNFLIRTLSTRFMFEAIGIKLGVGTLIFGLVYNYIPFMILPLHTTLSNIDKSFSEAASDLGANPINTFFKITFPLSIPGILSGITMVFIPTISTFAISQFLGGTSSHLFGDSINTKFEHQLYGVGSVMSIIMLIFVLISNYFMQKTNKGEAARNLW